MPPLAFPAIAVLRSSDELRFPPAMSARISSEIEAIAWNETDLLGDIPEIEPDVMYLAAMYSDLAADTWEVRNDLQHGYLPYRIVDAARKALLVRVQAEIDRREELVWAEYVRRQRAGLIDSNGVGEVPGYYEMLASDPTIGTMERESEPSGWMHPEVSNMATIARADLIESWHFECPECGMTHEELGAVEIHTIHCEVCLEDDNSHVRLKRWPADSGALPVRRAA